MRIYTRIVMGLTLMGLLVVVGSLYTYFLADRMTQAVSRVVHVEIPALSRLDRFQALVGEVHALETQILSEDRPTIDRSAFDVRIAKMKRLVNDIEPLPYGEPSDVQVREFKLAALDLITGEQEIMALQDAENLFDARQLATEIIELRMRVLESSAHLLALYRTYIEEKEGQNLDDLSRMRDTVRIYAVVSVLITLLLMISGVRSVLVPLRNLVAVTRSIGRGHLDRKANETRPYEFGELGKTINTMVGSLHQRLDDIAAMNTILQDADREHLRQLTLALNVQKSIVPRNVQVRGFDIYTRIQAARMIGGDFYDIVVLNESGMERRGRKPVVGFVVGDASGNGIAAALVMVLTMTLLREACRSTTDPAEILERVNRGIRDQFPNELIETFVTASYVVIEPDRRRLRFASAGNEPPILWRPSGIQSLEVEGMFLGTFEDTKYQLLELTIEQGDKIVMFSDGVTESRAPNGEFFGRERIERLVRDHGHEPVKDLGERIMAAVAEFSGDPTPRDDVALLLAEVKGDEDS